MSVVHQATCPIVDVVVQVRVDVVVQVRVDVVVQVRVDVVIQVTPYPL